MSNLVTNSRKPKRYWNKIIWTNLLFTYSILFLILDIFYKQGEWQYHLIVPGIMMPVTFGMLLYFVIRMILSKPISSLGKKGAITYALIGMIPFVGVFPLCVGKLIQKRKEENKKHFSPSAYTILFCLIIVVVLSIWLYYIVKGPVKDSDSNPLPIPGFIDIFLAPINGFVSAAELIVFLVVIGAFLQVVNSTKALDAGVGALIKKMHGKEILLIPIIMILFAIGGTTFGMCEETLPFYLILTPIMLSAGFDTLTSVYTILFGAGLGVAGSILNPFLISPAVDASTIAGVTSLTTTTGIVGRALILAILIIVGITYVMFHAHRVKKDPKHSVVYDMRNEHMKHFLIDSNASVPFTGKRKIILSIFGSTFLIMILMVIDWKTLTGYDGFNWLHQWLMEHLPFITSDPSMAIGSIYMVEMAFIFFVGTIIVGAIGWTSEQDFVKNVLTGAKDFLGVGLIIAIARGLSDILSSSGFNTIITDTLSKVFKDISNPQIAILIILAFFIVLSFFMPSTSGFAYAVFPIMGPSIQTANLTGLTVSGGITTFSLANGWVNVISPTSAPFVAGLEMCKVPLSKFYKGCKGFILTLLALIAGIVVAGTLLPEGWF